MSTTEPKKRFRWEAAHTVIAFTLTLLLIVYVVFGFLIWVAVQNSFSQSQENAQRGADLVARQTAWTIGSARNTLDLAVAVIDNRPETFGSEQAALTADAIAQMPANAELVLFDASGDVMPSASSGHLPDTFADAELFEAARNGQEWGISGQMQSEATGEPIFIVTRRITDAGRFTGVAALVFDAGVVSRIWEPLDLGDDSSASIVRDDGWVVSRFPALEEPLNAGDTVSFQAAQESETSGTVPRAVVSRVDGVSRVVAFTKLPQYGVISFGTVSQDAALSGLWSASITVMWLLGPISLALLAGSFLTASLLNKSARTQESLSQALQNNELLFREIHHRVKNNLQSVASLLQLQPIAREIKQEMAQRIAAMSAVHEHIYRSSNFATVNAKGYLETLIEGIRAGQSDNIDVKLDLNDVTVDKDTAMPLGLILNEVVSNAFKHAFPDGKKGTVSVTLDKQDDTKGVLIVQDDGVGFDPEVKSKGIGRRLVSGMALQIDAEVETSGSDGSYFKLTFPLAE